jgi:hypothetical protein
MSSSNYLSVQPSLKRSPEAKIGTNLEIPLDAAVKRFKTHQDPTTATCTINMIGNDSVDDSMIMSQQIDQQGRPMADTMGGMVGATNTATTTISPSLWQCSKYHRQRSLRCH